MLVTVVCVAIGLYVRSSVCFSSECPTLVTIVANQSICSKTLNVPKTEWQCADLQSALVLAAQTAGSEPVSSFDCVSIAVPAGDHLVTAPVHFGAASVYMFGSGESSEDVTISCNYTVDVDESRIFEPEYNYTDYTFYFNRSEVVSFEMVQFVGCPYPLRLDTVAAVRIHNSTFR